MKPGTFTQLYVHIVYAVYRRECLLHRDQREILYRFTSGIVTNKKCKSIIVNGFSDHIHIFTGLHPAVNVSDLVHDLKITTTKFINNEQNWFRGKFSWQDGYGVFSYGRSQITDVYNYILNQEAHHQKKPFREEYLDMLKKFDIQYDNRFLFEFYQ